jgi:hypothetical protein
MQDDEINYLYVISAIFDGAPVAPCKIGITRNPVSRLCSIQTGSHQKLEIIALLPIPGRATVQALEHALHDAFADSRLSGEWFSVSPVYAQSDRDYGS